MAIEAKIFECGNGFPAPGSYVPGDDEELYLLVEYVGQIQTGDLGSAHWSHCLIEEASWEDCSPDNEAKARVQRLDGRQPALWE